MTSGTSDRVGRSLADEPRERTLALDTLTSRLVAAGLVLLMDAVGYHLVGLATDTAQAHSLRLSIDDRIPFLPWSVYLYSWVYTAMLYPLFVVRCSGLFRRTVEAYAITIAVSLVVFAMFPVTSVGFRPDPATLDQSVFHNWGVALTFFVDPPTNLFPSLHLSIATLAALIAGRARPLFGWCAAPMVLAVAVSITTMKQHFVLDGVGALAVATFAFRSRFASFHEERDATGPLAYSWRGPVGYLFFHGVVYLALYVAFRCGFRPWDG
ncbi:MAG: phosphatase PAP2 family protein [Deltaproteobacteria bacterium]|nr:phosphatase PAP2 family protein [Deltaproteobacteria bacterium]